jgi:hypothetical protein
VDRCDEEADAALAVRLGRGERAQVPDARGRLAASEAGAARRRHARQEGEVVLGLDDQPQPRERDGRGGASAAVAADAAATVLPLLGLHARHAVLLERAPQRQAVDAKPAEQRDGVRGLSPAL